MRRDERDIVYREALPSRTSDIDAVKDITWALQDGRAVLLQGWINHISVGHK